uniref:Uncharacterized protein n=1 Tax=viral metagenome TaxID=1070528 RepID=A0A6C0HRB9_9ZZZZ
MDYERLCTLMTSRRQDVNYEDLTKKIVEIMYIKGRKAIEDFRNGIFSGCGKRRISFDVDFLSQKFEKIHNEIQEYIEDPNHVGLINIFAFQFSALISLPYKKDDPALYSDLDVLNEDELLEIIDLEYFDIKEYLDKKYQYLIFTRNADDMDITKDYTREILLNKKYPIFFFRWMEGEFSIEKIMREYFDRVYYCEIVGKAKYADGICEEPLGFLLHDRFHGEEAESNCMPFKPVSENWENSPELPINYEEDTTFKKDLSKLEKAEDFYNYCSQYQKAIFKKVRLIMFYQIHEGACYVDLSREKVKQEIDNIYYERFYDMKDLKEAIPKEYRKTNKSIDDYLDSCTQAYIYAYDMYQGWLTKLQRIKDTRKRSSKYKPSKSRKTIGGML